MDTIRSIVQSELNWDDHRWHQEVEAYIRRWQHSYSLPEAEAIGQG
jgi:hypothetical protein